MTRHLACISDGDFLRHTGAMLHSVLSHCGRDDLQVHLLHERPIAPQNADALSALFERGSAEIVFHQIADDQAAVFQSGYFPRAIWFRILLPDLLPELGRILYLDSDLIVCRDLSPVWSVDLAENYLAAVTNPFYPFMPDYPREVLGFRQASDYFNSGVLLMDLARMRDEGIVQHLVDYAMAHPRCAYPDQDALNVVCRDRWQPLAPTWNAQSTIFELADHELPFSAEDLQAARQTPGVVHFIGPFKPWSYLCRHPLQQRYFEHARHTRWGAPELADRNLRNVLLKRLPLSLIDRFYRWERGAQNWVQRLRRALRRRWSR